MKFLTVLLFTVLICLVNAAIIPRDDGLAKVERVSGQLDSRQDDKPSPNAAGVGWGPHEEDEHQHHDHPRNADKPLPNAAGISPIPDKHSNDATSTREAVPPPEDFTAAGLQPNSTVPLSEVADSTHTALLPRITPWNPPATGGPYCRWRREGTCTYAWQSFNDNGRWYHEACIYNNVCRPMANQWDQNTWPIRTDSGGRPLYQFATRRIHALEFDVITKNYGNYGPWFHPNFEYAGRKFGLVYCSCGRERLAPNAWWACECTFDCSPI